MVSNVKLGTYIFAILLFLGIMIYIYYDYLVKIGETEENILVVGTVDFNKKRDYEKRENIATVIGTRDSLFSGEGYGLTFTFDLYIPNTMGNKGWESNYNNMRPIIRWGESPHIYYNHRKNYMSVMVKYKDNPYYVKRPNINVEIPLQKWNKVVVVINNRKILIFINGELTKAFSLGNVPIISSYYLNNIIIGESGNNINGKLRDMNVIFRPLETSEILLQ